MPFTTAAEGTAFVERFTHVPGAEYPDNGATVECWTVGAGQVGNLDYADSGIYLMETEVLAPLRTIAPGRETRFRIEWGACRCAGPVVRAGGGGEAGCVAAPLTAIVTGEEVHLTGSFGVFDRGRLLLSLKDDDGGILHQHDLGPGQSARRRPGRPHGPTPCRRHSCGLAESNALSTASFSFWTLPCSTGGSSLVRDLREAWPAHNSSSIEPIADPFSSCPFVP